MQHLMKKLPLDFYIRYDVVTLAKELLGKIVFSEIDGRRTSGRIVETEAYAGISDRASHSFNGRRTRRNEHMYSKGGTAYIYICYGIHRMLNVVTNVAGVPDAILIRAIEPLDGHELMLERTNKKTGDVTITKGPGNVAKSLGIAKIHSGELLTGPVIYLADDGYVIEKDQIGESKRIGVDYAGADALLPYRFYVKGNCYVSGKPFK